MKKKPLASEGGNILVTVLMVAAMLAAFYLVYANFTSIGAKSVNHSLAIQRATYSAESGYYAALDWLKTPAADFLTTVAYSTSSLTQGTTYQVVMQRTVVDPSLINIVSTGFFETPEGPDLDPLGKRAYTAVVEGKVRIEFIRDYFAVVPGLLPIAPGTDLSAGKVYGKDLVFQPGAANSTKIQAAYYYSSVNNPAPPVVQFGDGGPAHQVPTELGAPRVSVMDDYYSSLANDPVVPCVLPVVSNECVLTSPWTPPANPLKVCYCDGDLVLGRAGPLTIYQNAVIYVTGATKIENSIITPNPPDDWIAVLSVQDVAIQATAPDLLTINGTFVTDGGINSLTGSRPGGHLTFRGGVVSQQGISLADYQHRVYSYQGADSTLKLPFLVQSIGWAIKKGKYQ